MEYGLGKKKRRWLRFLSIAVATMINPVLGGVVALAWTYLRGGSHDDIDVSQEQNDLADDFIRNIAVPTINTITENILDLLATRKSTTQIIEELNIALKQISVMQAYVSLSIGNNSNVVDYLIAKTIEPYLAGMNTLVTNVINSNNLQGVVESQAVSFVASDVSNVLSFEFNWYDSVTTKTYQELVVVNNSTTDTVIVPTADNEDLSNAIEVSSNNVNNNNQVVTTDNIKTSKFSFKNIGFGLAIFSGLRYFAKKSDAASKKTPYKAIL